jgi:tryptophan halogenase
MHYKLTQRNDSDYWDAYRNMDIPEDLAHRLAIFQKNGYASDDDAGLFHVTSWVQVMMGQGLDPEQHHGAGRVLPAAGLKEQLEILKKSVDTNLNKLPSHQDFIQKYCPSSIAES